MPKLAQTNIALPEWRRTLYGKARSLLYPRAVKRNERRYVLTGNMVDSLDDSVRVMVELIEKKYYRKFSDEEGRTLFGGELWAHLHKDEWGQANG